MPDSIGRLTLREIRTRVWQILDSYRPAEVETTVDQDVAVDAEHPDGKTNALSTPPFDVNPLYPRDEVNSAINAALREKYAELILNSSLPLSDEVTIDIVEDQTEYSLPFDFAQVKGLWWKDPLDSRTVVPINEREYMHQVEDEQVQGIDLPFFTAPTYRRQLNFIVLNQIPQQDNPGGILVRYVKWINWLSVDDQYIETEFAPILQEVVIWTAAIELAQTKSQLSVPDWERRQQKWEERLSLMARAANNPPFTILYRPAVKYGR